MNSASEILLANVSALFTNTENVIWRREAKQMKKIEVCAALRKTRAV